MFYQKTFLTIGFATADRSQNLFDFAVYSLLMRKDALALGPYKFRCYFAMLCEKIQSGAYAA